MRFEKARPDTLRPRLNFDKWNSKLCRRVATCTNSSSSHLSGRLQFGLRASAPLYTQIVDCIFNEAGLKVRLEPHEFARRHHLIHNEPRMICCQFEFLLLHDLVHNELEVSVVHRQTLAFALRFEYLPVKVRGWRADLDLVGQPP